jgi:thiol-disulfide isomerase/thioredoxin
MLALLPLGVLSFIVDLTPSGITRVISGYRPVLVMFTSPKCEPCRDLREDFELASGAFSNVTFATLNCAGHAMLCDEYNVSNLPEFRFFWEDSNESVLFNGFRAFDGYIDFIENITGIKATRPPPAVRYLNGTEYYDVVTNTSTKCLLVTHYQPWDPYAKIFIPEFRLLAQRFAPEKDVKFAAVHCTQFKKLCEMPEVNATRLKVRFFKNGEEYVFRANGSIDSMSVFLNVNCGTQRAPDGLLIDSAGIDSAGRELVKEFLDAKDKAAVVAKGKAAGLTDYVSVLETYVAGGYAAVEFQAKALLQEIEARAKPWPELDALKKKYNVFALIVPRPTPVPTPTPTPLPLRTSNPNADLEERAAFKIGFDEL